MGLAPEELAVLLAAWGEPAYRARQLLAWLHRGAAPEQMSDLPRALRARLAEGALAGTLRLHARETAPDGATKVGFLTHEGHLIETVVIPHQDRTTVCVSSQIGCAYGCRFCATGRQGFTRDLSAGEIVEQVVRAQALIQPRRVSHVVFMGMGEPLANYDAVVKAVRLLNHPNGLHIGARRIALSTCGIPDRIRRLAGEGLPVALAISLHAASDELRSRFVPVNRTHPIAEVVAAAREYAKRTGRKVVFEYVVVPGVNDSAEQAGALAAITRQLPSVVNLIPQNQPERHMSADAGPARRFARRLDKRGVPVAVRASRGAEVLAACGQLRDRLARGPGEEKGDASTAGRPPGGRFDSRGRCPV